MRIDIRNTGVQKITSIVFADCEKDGDNAYSLELSGSYTKLYSANNWLFVDSKEDAQNLIKALQKAIELGELGMTVGEIIEQLKQYPESVEIVVSDGYRCKFYKGSFVIKEFEGTVDIGVGGTDYEN